MACWQEGSQEFDFTRKYRSWQINADCMSCISYSCGTINSVLIAATEIDWSSLQAADLDLQLTYQRQLHENNEPSMIWLKNQSLVTLHVCAERSCLRLYGNMLFLVSASKHPLLIVPRVQVQNIMEQVHRELGHSRKWKTEQAICQRFWWLSMHEDTTEVCKNCGTCFATKSSQQILSASASQQR